MPTWRGWWGITEGKMKFEPQVPREHYFKDYDTKERFISYWYQIDEVLRTKLNNALDVGIGNKMVRTYLKSLGLDITTLDIDLSLEPDHICSVTDLSDYFEINFFDEKERRQRLRGDRRA